MSCYLFETPFLGIFVSGLELVYYTHLPTLIVSFTIGLFIFLHGQKVLASKILLWLVGFFSLWVFANLILWTNINSQILLFAWSFIGPLYAIIAIFSIYFIYTFLYEKDIGAKAKLLFILLLVPAFIIAPTSLNVAGFDITDCNAFDFESIWFQIYYFGLGGVAILSMAFLGWQRYKDPLANNRADIIPMVFSMFAFIFLFFFLVFVSALLVELEFFKNSDLETYGLFGMTILMVYISSLLTKKNIFKIHISTSHLVVYGLIILIGAQFAFIRNDVGLILNAFALILTIIAGHILIRSVNKETRQKEELQRITNDLQKANQKLVELDKTKNEFLSIASHQLRAPISVIRGYASNILDGSYGAVPKKLKEPFGVIAESARTMAAAIEDYLNISRIEQGRMKYEKTSFNITQLAQGAVEELAVVAKAKKLSVLFTSDIQLLQVYADQPKVKQVLSNIIDNAIKYTKKGSIDVRVEEHDGFARVSVIDTGVGLSKEAITHLFHKFTRARGANAVNTTGTGLGLYVAKQLIEGHGGKIWVESEGEGKGSSFIFEIPVSK